MTEHLTKLGFMCMADDMGFEDERDSAWYAGFCAGLNEAKAISSPTLDELLEWIAKRQKETLGITETISKRLQ